MAGTVTKSLYLQIGGDVTALNTAAKAGKSVLASLGDAAVDVQAEVKRAFSDLGDSIPDKAKQIERSFADTFATIRRNAQSVLDAPNGKAAVQVINANAANEAAASAEKQAVALRQVAVAASTVADRAGKAGAAERVLAVASAAVAERAEQEAIALRNQANLLGTVEAEIRATGDGFDDASDKVVKGHNKMGNSGAILQHVVRSTTDSFAAGLPVSIIFAEQIGRLGEAASFAAQEGKLQNGVFAKFGEVMSGPVGLGLTVAVSVASALIPKLLESSDAMAEETKKLEENAKQAEVSERAKRAFLTTEAGARDDVRALTDELRKQNDELRSNAELLNIRAKKDLAVLQGKRPGLVTAVNDAQSDLKGARLAPGIEGGTIAIAEASGRLERATAALAANDTAIAQANAARLQTQKDLAGEAAKRQADPLEQIKRKYEGPDGLIQQAKKQASAEETVNGVLTRRLFLLNQQEKAETEAEQKRQSNAKKTPNENQIGREITVAQATAIAASIGGRVTSGYRSTEKQEQLYADHLAGRHAGPVAKPGTSDHERGQAIDIAYGPGISVSSIRAAFAKEGVAIRQLLDERDQKVFHVGFGKKGPSAEATARREQAAITKGANDDRAFTNADRQADDAIARAKLQLTDSIEGEYKLRVDQIAADLTAKNRAVQDQVTAGKLSQAQADQLKLKNDELGMFEEAIATEKRRVALANAAFQLDSDASAGRLALLQIDAALATTRRDRLTIERQILDEEQKRQRDAAQHAVDVAAPGSAEQDRARAEQARLPGLQAAQDRQFGDQHLDALGSYKKQLRENVGDMKDALKSVEVDGLRGIEDGFAGIISGTETVEQAFGRMAESILADLARIAVEKAVLSVLGFSTGGEVGSVTPAQNAGGGFITGKGSGTSDDILSWLSNGEFVMNAAATRKHLPMLRAMNDNRLPAFATGGLVGGLPDLPKGYPATPRASQLTTTRRSDVHVNVDARGSSDPDSVQRAVARGIAEAAPHIRDAAVVETLRIASQPRM